MTCGQEAGRKIRNQTEIRVHANLLKTPVFKIIVHKPGDMAVTLESNHHISVAVTNV